MTTSGDSCQTNAIAYPVFSVNAMLSSHSPRSATSTVEDTNNPQKLKESCDDCSISKVKCTREKPSCQRCIRRGRPCVYATSRRSGRFSVKSSTADTDDSAMSTKEQNADTRNEAMHSSLTADAMISALTNEEWFPRDDTWPGSTSSETAASSVGFWADLGSSVGTEQADANALFGLGSESTLTAAALTLPEIEMSLDDTGLWAKPSDHQPSAAVAPVALMLPARDDAPVAAENITPDKQHGCLTTATELMLSLFPRSCSNDEPSLPLEVVLGRNRLVIDSATKIMMCPCTKDGYLAALLSLILLRTMASYVSVVEDCSLPHPAAPHMRQAIMDNEMVQQSAEIQDQGWQEQRNAAQRVMGELYHVQRLKKLVSGQLEEQSLLQGCSDSGIGSSYSFVDDSNASIEGSSSIGTSQLSPGMLNSLDEEIRGRFRAVSSATIERLRII